jgi:Tfp pilus assembly protein PilN
MAARTLQLDFERPVAVRPWGTILLALGALVAAWVLVEYSDATDEIRRWEGKLADTKRLARRSLPSFAVEDAPSTGEAQEIKAANAVLDQLAAPWDKLFADIEAATIADVALLGVQPDPRGRLVNLEGEARDLKALLTFLARLEAAPALTDAHLTRHEIRANDANRPLVFTIRARWNPPL